MLVLVFDPLAILLVVAANMQLNYATGKRIDFLSLDEVSTETAEELYGKWEDKKTEEDAELLESSVMDVEQEVIDKVASGQTLNPGDRKKALDWLIDKKRS